MPSHKGSTKYPTYKGSTKYPTRYSDFLTSRRSKLRVTQTSLSASELESLVKSFDPDKTRFVTQIVEGSTVSLTITPTRAGND